MNREEINACFQTSEAKNLILEHLNKSSEPYLAMMSLIWPDKVLKTTITRELKCVNCLNFIQVNLCQKLLFLHQLTQNMTTECSLNYDFSERKIASSEPFVYTIFFVLF
jgi:hypothetical protein